MDFRAVDEVHDLLSSRVPPQRDVAIVHGDYRLDNCMIGDDGRIVAVLDWELCTLGDPLADLGYILNNWAAPGEDGPMNRGAAEAPTQAGGFLSREDLVARYQGLTGRDVSQVDYYRAFQYWRLAAIVEGVMARYLKGVMGDEADTDTFREQVDGLAQAALGLIEPVLLEQLRVGRGNRLRVSLGLLFVKIRKQCGVRERRACEQDSDHAP
jgi:aminoglycoside phosphotransferase (APT) family kinase protein